MLGASWRASPGYERRRGSRRIRTVLYLCAYVYWSRRFRQLHSCLPVISPSHPLNNYRTTTATMSDSGLLAQAVESQTMDTTLDQPVPMSFPRALLQATAGLPQFREGDVPQVKERLRKPLTKSGKVGKQWVRRRDNGKRDLQLGAVKECRSDHPLAISALCGQSAHHAAYHARPSNSPSSPSSLAPTSPRVHSPSTGRSGLGSAAFNPRPSSSQPARSAKAATDCRAVC